MVSNTFTPPPLPPCSAAGGGAESGGGQIGGGGAKGAPAAAETRRAAGEDAAAAARASRQAGAGAAQRLSSTDAGRPRAREPPPTPDLLLLPPGSRTAPWARLGVAARSPASSSAACSPVSRRPPGPQQQPVHPGDLLARLAAPGEPLGTWRCPPIGSLQPNWGRKSLSLSGPKRARRPRPDRGVGRRLFACSPGGAGPKGAAGPSHAHLSRAGSDGEPLPAFGRRERLGRGHSQRPTRGQRGLLAP